MVRQSRRDHVPVRPIDLDEYAMVKQRCRLCLVMLTVTIPLASAQEPDAVVRKISTVTHQPITEMSGIVKSHRYEGVYWVHNDSGDAPRIFPIDRSGSVIIPDCMHGGPCGESSDEGRATWPGLAILSAAHIDWEDIARAGEYLVIADVGNNLNARRDLGLYFVAEPNPRSVTRARILKYVPVRYPEQENYPARLWHFDSESIFAADGKLYLLSKHRQPGKVAQWEPGAVLYRLDTQHTDQENVLTRIDSHDAVTLATGADLSPDGSKLAIVSYPAVWVFARPDSGDRWLSGLSYQLDLDTAVTRQTEAICWDDNETLLITNESRELFEISLADLRPVAQD